MSIKREELAKEFDRSNPVTSFLSNIFIAGEIVGGIGMSISEEATRGYFIAAFVGGFIGYSYLRYLTEKFSNS